MTTPMTPPPFDSLVPDVREAAYLYHIQHGADTEIPEYLDFLAKIQRLTGWRPVNMDNRLNDLPEELLRRIEYKTRLETHDIPLGYNPNDPRYQDVHTTELDYAEQAINETTQEIASKKP